MPKLPGKLSHAERTDRVVEALKELLGWLQEGGVIASTPARVDAIARAVAPLIVFASK